MTSQPYNMLFLCAGTDEQKQQVFDKVFRQISTRIKLFTSLPVATLDRSAIQHEMRKIGDRTVDSEA